ncbi:MAG TPA: hypothetical protein VFG35_04670, partial [Actinoplanes sp.]|nr:hypothetical protein [Actinoplanes sp.]
MRLSKSILILIVFLLVLSVAGCGDDGGGGAPDSGAVDSSVADGRAVDSGGGSDDAGMEPGGPGLAGTLADEAGVPIGFEMVLACMATTCLFGESEADGRFAFAIEPPAEVALKTPPDLSTTPRRAAALCPVRIVDDALIKVGTLYVPSLPQGVPIGSASADPQTLMAGDGLELTLRRADLTPRIGDVLVDVAARLVPLAQVCPQLDLGGEEIVAVYALHPFAAVSASPIAVRAPSDLPSGTAVKFRT